MTITYSSSFEVRTGTRAIKLLGYTQYKVLRMYLWGLIVTVGAGDDGMVTNPNRVTFTEDVLLWKIRHNVRVGQAVTGTEAPRIWGSSQPYISLKGGEQELDRIDAKLDQYNNGLTALLYEKRSAEAFITWTPIEIPMSDGDWIEQRMYVNNSHSTDDGSVIGELLALVLEKG